VVIRASLRALRLVVLLNFLRLFSSSYSVLIALGKVVGVGTYCSMFLSSVKRPSIRAASLASLL
jgi:hypothetical protein